MTEGYKGWIAEILKASARVEEKARGITKDAFLRDRTARDALEEDLFRIGKAIEMLPGKIKKRYPDIDWEVMSRTGPTEDDELWDVARSQVPAFGKQVKRILFDITD
jgi:uncharacterized protein with HEPN domain